MVDQVEMYGIQNTRSYRLPQWQLCVAHTAMYYHYVLSDLCYALYLVDPMLFICFPFVHSIVFSLFDVMYFLRYCCLLFIVRYHRGFFLLDFVCFFWWLNTANVTKWDDSLYHQLLVLEFVHVSQILVSPVSYVSDALAKFIIFFADVFSECNITFLLLVLFMLLLFIFSPSFLCECYFMYYIVSGPDYLMVNQTC